MMNPRLYRKLGLASKLKKEMKSQIKETRKAIKHELASIAIDDDERTVNGFIQKIENFRSNSLARFDKVEKNVLRDHRLDGASG